MLSVCVTRNAEVRPKKMGLAAIGPSGRPPTDILVGPVYGVAVLGNRTTIPCAPRPHE